LIALKTILKEIDPLKFDEVLKMDPKLKKQFAIKQNEDERKTLDR